MNKQHVIEKIQKLLALSQSSNEHEAALALAQAELLLERHRLEMTEIEMMGGERESIVQDEEAIFDTLEPLSGWESRLANGIAMIHGSVVIRIGESTLKVIGRESDILFIKYFINYITIELFRISAGSCSGKGKKYKDSWFLGAVDTIIYRLKEAKEEVQSNTTNKFAVVKLNNRYEEACDYMKELYKDIIYEKPKKPSRVDAYSEGAQAGHKIQLTRNKSIAKK